VVPIFGSPRLPDLSPWMEVKELKKKMLIEILIGIYSAIHQYSGADYTLTVIGFAGMAIPNFLLTLVLMLLFYKYFGVSLTGLFSSQYAAAAWSMGKFMDLLAHIPIPIIVIGTAGTATNSGTYLRQMFTFLE